MKLLNLIFILCLASCTSQRPDPDLEYVIAVLRIPAGPPLHIVKS